MGATVVHCGHLLKISSLHQLLLKRQQKHRDLSGKELRIKARTLAWLPPPWLRCVAWGLCLGSSELELETVQRRAVRVMGGMKGLLHGEVLYGEGMQSLDSRKELGKAAKSNFHLILLCVRKRCHFGCTSCGRVVLLFVLQASLSKGLLLHLLL